MAHIIQAKLATTRPTCSHELLDHFVPAFESYHGVECPRAVALVTVDADGMGRTLIIDQDWIDFARSARDVNPELIEGLDVPASAILGMVPGFPDDWPAPDRRQSHWSLSSDGVMVLVPDGPPA